MRGSAARRPPQHPDAGMVLLETALAIPMLLAVALLVIGTGRIAVGELAVVAAARDGALAASRGASAAGVSELVLDRLPGAAVQVQFQAGSGAVRVTVSRPVAELPLIGQIAPYHRAEAVAAREP